MNTHARQNLRLVRPVESSLDPFEKALVALPPVPQRVTKAERLLFWALAVLGCLAFWYGTLGFIWWCCR